MSEMNILDCHQHLWSVDRLNYKWIQDLPELNKNFLPEDYSAAVEGIHITDTVFVQCECDRNQTFSEVEMISEFAESDSRIKGIVAFAPLEEGDAVRPHLEKLKTYPLVKGVRRIVQGLDVGYSTQENFIRGNQVLSEYGLTSDICIKHYHLPDTIKLVSSCPDTSFMLDHIAKPAIEAGEIDEWKRDMESLAALDNVVCKISGVANEGGAGWSVDSIRPYILHAVEVFGEDRIMFGGDWPVINLVGNYRSWFEALTEVLSDVSINTDKLFSENGSRFYKL